MISLNLSLHHFCAPTNLCYCLLLSLSARPPALRAEPVCVEPDSKSYVLAWSLSNLTDGWEAQWILQNVETLDRIFLRRCSMDQKYRGCYYATNVVPGKYYFQQVMPDALNSAYYPVSKKALWFQITGKGVDYIGDWTIERSIDRVVKRLEIKYQLKTLDQMVEACKIKGKKIFLSKTLSLAQEIVD